MSVQMVGQGVERAEGRLIEAQADFDELFEPARAALRAGNAGAFWEIFRKIVPHLREAQVREQDALAELLTAI